MPRATSYSVPALPWRSVGLTAMVAVAGALAMTVVLGVVVLISAAMRGLPADELPALLSSESQFPFVGAAGGLVSALVAGYFAVGTCPSPAWFHGFAAGALTVGGHLAVNGILGSPLPDTAAALYIALTLPAVGLGWYLGSPSD